LLKASYRQAGDLVNEYFELRLFNMPEIVAYLDSLGG
jgi:hypothetical protein